MDRDHAVSALVRRVSVGGLVISLLGFTLTRFTVTLTLDGDPLRFVVAGLLPLTLGLGLSAFGIALAIGSVGREYARTTAVWTVVGAGAMLVLVVLTIVGAGIDQMGQMGGVTPGAYLSNFLIGGAIGGALTGLYAAENRKQRIALRQQTDRLAVLNRSLRDRVLNAVLAIDGQMSVVADRDDPQLYQQVASTVRDQADTIQRTVEDVKYLARSTADAQKHLDAIDLTQALEEAIASVEAEYPDVEIEVTDRPDGEIAVWGNVMLERAIEHVLARAADDEATTRVRIAVESTARTARLRVTDDGEGLSPAQRRILEGGASGEYDDPSVGFGLNVVRLVTDTLDGNITCAETNGETTVEVEAPRADTDTRPGQASGTDVRAYGVPTTDLGIAVGAAILAGVAMGLVGQATSGVVPIIGALYGNTNALVGWVTHEFHSVVFGLVFAGILATVPEGYAEDWRWCLATGLGWAFTLWLVASGIVMPLWLELVGIPAVVPSLSPWGLLSHLVWGLTLSVLYMGGTMVLDRRGLAKSG
ncbi:sensor histidine kinase KdpD [Halorhabdus sp. CUG00001]|uniref:sensor histidine kinase n=1 Tax=Halorhabdus sp. CUG00001 TaxID=2600297 RepID=UPI00131DB6BD|nr:HAMP domain-containing sensor histidine kinase [Halorhabdus sp. CUG00001]